MKDKYDLAVEYFKMNRNEIDTAWFSPYKHQAGCLFQFVAPSQEDVDGIVGCLTMIKHGNFVAYNNPELTKQIKEDDRIPNNVDCYTPIETLEYLASYQRKIDVIYGRN